jgi:tetratricopeptide (TPR) repeat protein
MTSMAEAVAFQAATRARVLQELASSATPKRLSITVDGVAKDLLPRLSIRVGGGRLIEARAGSVEGQRALTRFFLAHSGIVEVEPDQSPAQPLDRYAPLQTALQEAEGNAQALSALLQTVGGLEGVLVADLDELMTQLAHLPDAASAVLRLADGMRNVAAMLRDSPYEEVLTARILQRLFLSGVLCFTAEQDAIAEAPEQKQPFGAGEASTGWDMSSGLPTEDEFEGAGVEQDIRHWLAHEQVPEALLSDVSFSQAFALADSPGSALQRSVVRSAMPEKTLASATVTPAPIREDKSERPAPPPPPPRNSESAPSWPKPAFEPRAGEVPSQPEEIADGFDDDEELDDDRGGHRVALWVGLAVAAIAILIAVLARKPEPQADPREDQRAEEQARVIEQPNPSITATSAVATASATKPAVLTLQATSVRPPIAGPDAPEDVKKAEALLDAGSYAAAAKLLEQLRATRAGDAAVWVLSGQLYVDSGGRLQPAKDAAEKAIQIEPKFYRAWVLKGSVAQFMGNRKLARESYEKALALEPDHPMSSELRAITGQL